VEKRWEALDAFEAELKAQNVPTRHSHMVGFAGTGVFMLLEELAKEGGFQEYSKTLPIKRKCYYMDLARVFSAAGHYKKDILRWKDPYTLEYYCYARPEEENPNPPEETLTVTQDPETGVVSISSNLGTVHNGPFANL
jgi:hypothetical protein